MSALSVLDARKQLTLSDTIAPHRVGHDHPQYILQTLQKPLEEALCSVGIAPGLNEDDGTPEIALHTSYSDDNLVHVPLVPWPWPAAAQAVSETRSEFLAPTSYRLVGDRDAALSQEQLNVPQAEAERVIQPDGVADDLGWKPMPVVGSLSPRSWRRITKKAVSRNSGVQPTATRTYHNGTSHEGISRQAFSARMCPISP
jgi:hypothetical protein